MTVAFVFPGQGSQEPGMLGTLVDSPAVRATLDEAAEQVGDISRLDTEAGLATTTGIQLALLTCGVAAARACTDDRAGAVDIVAGHSVGAFAAAVVCGVLSFSDALEVVRVRGEAMTRACPDGRWGMAAVTGLSRRAVASVVGSVGVDPGELWIANVNAADQLVLGGTRAALALAQNAAERAGARRFELLDVPIASHGPVQCGTESVLRERLSRLPRRAQTVDYVTNRGARRIREDSAAVIDDLAASITHPVRWYDIARLLPELGVTQVREMPPGHVLSALIASATTELDVRTA